MIFNPQPTYSTMDASGLSINLQNVTDALTLLAVFAADVVISYFAALLFSIGLKKLMTAKEINDFLIRYGAMTSKMWESTATFITQYLKWYLTFLLTAIGFDIILAFLTPDPLAVKMTEITLVKWAFEFLTSLLWFIVLTAAGLIAGGIVCKIIKEALEDLGLEEQMKKHRIEGAFGGIPLSTLISGTVKWYVVLLFMNEGTLKLDLPVLSKFIGALVAYIPDVLSGIMILIVTLIIARFTSGRIRERNLGFSEAYALIVETMIIFFGIVLSLPIFIKGVDVSILTDSFKILTIGISLGMAIALGLGLKDSITEISTRYGKKL
jgi:hypothetical protein